MNLEPLKPGEAPDEPAYTAPEEIVLPEENDEPDVFDEEVGVDDELTDYADFDVEETNAKEVSE